MTGSYAELDERQAEIVRRRFDFDGWRGRNRLAEQLISYNTNAAVRLPGYEPMRVRRPLASAAGPFDPALTRGVARDLAGRDVEASPPPALPAVRSAQVLWRSASAPGAVVRVDLFERDSQLDAHAFLLRLLADFQSPLVERKDVAVGDVVFGGRSDGLLLFARANLVYLLRNIGWQREPVLTIALGLDADAISEPETQDADAEREAIAPAVAGARRTDGQVEIAVAALEAVPRAARIKVFAHSGDLQVEAGRIVFRGPEAAARALRVRRYS